ncbi:MAG: PAS domain-containing protein, partial [Rhodospirillaceae bacterium]|nr:PAS domain-containing protein [Rhodospirillaceae bacterium]
MAAPKTPPGTGPDAKEDRASDPGRGDIAAIAAVFAASSTAQALFDAGGNCVAATAEFTRRAAATADADGRIDPAFLDGADMKAVRIGNRDCRLVTLGAVAAKPTDPDAQMRSAFDAIPAAISVKDAVGRFLFMNAYQARLWGVEAAAAPGGTSASLRGYQSERSIALERHVLETGEAVPFYEENHVDAAGATRDWLITKLPLRRPEQGGAAGVVRS